MSILLAARDVVIFILLAGAYFVFLRSILQGCFFIIGLGMAIVARIRGAEIGPAGLATVSRLEALALGVCGLMIIAVLQLREPAAVGWLRFWENPMWVALFAVSALHCASGGGGYNPLHRQVSAFFITFSWTILFTIVAAATWPEAFTTRQEEWAVLVAAASLLAAAAFSVTKVVGKIRDFEILDDRHDEIGRQLLRLQQIGSVLPDTNDWSLLQEAIRNVESSYRKAMQALRQDNVRSAEEIILQAEAEVEGLQRTVNDRIYLSLKDEIRAKLTRASADCEQLRQESEAAGLQHAQVAELEAELASLMASLDQIDFDPNKLLPQIAPFEALFRKIITMRTALRFYDNVGSSLTSVRNDLARSERDILIADQLDLPNSVACNSRDRLSAILDKLQREPPTTAEQLVERYRDLRLVTSEHVIAMKALAQEIRRRYRIESLQHPPLDVYVPTASTTKDGAVGLLCARYNGDPGSEAIDCELDGVLLDFQAQRTVSLRRSGQAAFALTPFHFAGKRAGTGRLIVKVTQPEVDGQQSLLFPIVITSSLFETARDVFAFATPFGSVAVLVLWWWLRDITKAAPVGACIGALFGLFILFSQRVEWKRGRSLLGQRQKGLT